MKAPFVYFGGKSRIAAEVWQAIGQPAHYIEPFFGSGAVLLARKNYNSRKHTETVCDKDGHLANVWRSLQADPDGVAKMCDWPVNHADLIARRRRLAIESESLCEKLCADDKYYDVRLAGYWIWGASCSIGNGMLGGVGRPALKEKTRGVQSGNSIPNVSGSGGGVHCSKGRQHLTSAGQGVNKRGNSIPHLGDAGRSLHSAKKKVAAPSNAVLDLTDPHNEGIYVWFRRLAERLRSVRVVCGDWSRVCGGNWQTGMGPCGIFFDPPYGVAAQRTEGIYGADSLTVAADVQAWCREHGNDPKMRIVLAGYREEHLALLDSGWREHAWVAQGGYANQGKEGGKCKKNRFREALFLSPGCRAIEYGLL